MVGVAVIVPGGFAYAPVFIESAIAGGTSLATGAAVTTGKKLQIGESKISENNGSLNLD